MQKYFMILDMPLYRKRLMQLLLKIGLISSKNIKIDFSNPIGVIVDIIENREKDFSNEIERLWKIEKIY